MINSAGFKLPDNMPDHSKLDRPSNGVLFAENAKLGKELTANNPGKVVTVRQEPVYKEPDFCEKFADILVNRYSKSLISANLKMNIPEFLVLLETTYGPKYKVTTDWFGQKRKVVSKAGSKQLSMDKVVARLKTHGINVPAISASTMSFNDMRKHLQGKGNKQEFNVLADMVFVLGRNKVLINRRSFHWVNFAGCKCLPEDAIGLRATLAAKGNQGPQSMIAFDVLQALTGHDRDEIIRRCNTAPQ